MDMRQITETYSVSPQIDPSDFSGLAAEGITTVICNRPDGEVAPSHYSNEMRRAAEAAGLDFHVLPLTHQTLTPDNIARHKAIIDESCGEVLAYCASGTRSTIVWALGQAGHMPVSDIISAAAAGGYDISNLAPTLEAIERAQNRE